MSMTVMQLEQAIERAEREGRQADVEKLRFLLGEVTGDRVTNTTPGQAYTVQDGDDVFGISEMLLGSIEYVPDLLEANPDINFATGDEIVVPEVGGDEATAAASDAAALVELFETKGPPNGSWTAEDYTLLEAVQAQTPAPVGGIGGGGVNGGNASSGSEVSAPGGESQVKEDETRNEAAVRIPSGGADFELPAEDAEVIAQFMAQMIMNGVVPDGSAWGADSHASDIGQQATEAESDNQQQEEKDEAKKYLDIWYEAAAADARRTGVDVVALRQDYERYLAAIEAGDLSAQEAELLIYPESSAVEKNVEDENQTSELEELIEEAGYEIERFELAALMPEDQQLLTKVLMGKSEDPGISLDDYFNYMNDLQTYLDLSNADMASLLREIYYPELLDPFIAGASDIEWDLQPIQRNKNGVSSHEAALALNILLLGK